MGFSLFPFPLYNYIITCTKNNTMQFCCNLYEEMSPVKLVTIALVL
nr:MAG TPA: hypothetical protein [Caudoviricetes sp.]